MGNFDLELDDFDKDPETCGRGMPFVRARYSSTNVTSMLTR
jgi:hypothetical protein